MLVVVRCALAFTALVTWIPPAEYGRSDALAYPSLLLYCAYSVIVALNSYRLGWPVPWRAFHWVDVLFYGYLVELTAGTSSVFFFFFFFAIMTASFSWGFREGMAVTLASVALFVTIGFTFAPAVNAFGLNRTLIRPVFLLVFGYLIAYWGGYESLIRRRLKLLQEINNLWNPRFGVDHAIGSNLERLLEFYGASSCVLVLRWANTAPGCRMYRASAGKPGQSMRPSSIVEGAAAALLRLPDTLAAFYHDPAASWRNRFRGHRARGPARRAQSNAFLGELAELANLANLLDAQAFITVPYAQRDGTAGRLYVISARGGFTQSDIDFLVQVSGAMATIIEHMYLMQELISNASEHERLKISRDLHDTTIQPYIGLKLALTALQREAGSANPLSPRIAELIDMADMTIHDLRNYAATLKEKTSMPGDFLVAAVNKQAERMQRFYGIDVEVKCEISPQLPGRIAAEAFQIIFEGLSNVLRHSAGKSAFVHVRCEDSRLLLEIGNDVVDGGPDIGEFTPRSIDERTRALGGELFVERRADGYTVVHATIPMD
jgi:signal transduction histidine kinase